MSKVNHTKSPLFFPLESLKTRLDKFSNGLDEFSNGLECLETRLEPRSSKFSRIEDRESSFELRASRDCQLTFERYCIAFTTKEWGAGLFNIHIVQCIKYPSSLPNHGYSIQLLIFNSLRQFCKTLKELQHEPLKAFSRYKNSARVQELF